jgi:hypothetical protein
VVEVFDEHVRPAADDSGTLSSDTLDSVRETLVSRREEMADRQRLERRLGNVRADLVESRERTAALTVEVTGYEVVAGGLRKSYKQARNRMQEAYADPEFERFHEWCKRIEYHRYHSRFLRSIWTGPMKAPRAELKELSDVIGYENDLAEFGLIMHDEDLFGIDHRKPLPEHTVDELLNMRSLAPDGRYTRPYWFETRRKSPRVCFGHTALSEPLATDRAVGLDTGCVHGRQLTAYDYRELRFVAFSRTTTYEERSSGSIVTPRRRLLFQSL